MLKGLKRLTSKEWMMILVSLVFIVVQVWLTLRVPRYMYEITMIVTTEGGVLRDVWVQGGMMLLVTLGGVVTSIVISYFGAKVAASFAYSLRRDIFTRVESFSMEEVNGFSTASLITRTTNDVTQIQTMIVMGLQVIVQAPIMAVWAVARMSAMDTSWTVLTGGMAASIVIMISLLFLYVLPKFRRIQELTDNVNRVTRENLAGIRVVRAYNAEKFQEAKFEEVNDDFTAKNLTVTRAFQIMQPFMRMIMMGLGVGIFWIGAFLIDAAAVYERLAIFGNMVVFQQYATQVIMSFMMLTMVLIMMPRVMVSIKRVNEVLDTKPTIVDGNITVSPAGVAGEVEFKNVSFKYPDADEYVLNNISFKAHQGETVAFIGSTGSGKSTLINLVPRFYDATEGQVLIDGIDVRDYTQEALRDKLGYVPQRAVMFTGSVSLNVAFGRDEEPDEIKKAVQIAQGQEFVEKMHDTYEALISQGGTNLSGGQRQRLAIARAVYRKPEIYIFDDSFSALDYKTDRSLRSALKRETQGTTNLIVAQRIGTIRDADRIIVLDEGKIVGTGTHDELMGFCEVYQEIAYSQLSKEELGA
jgi:ATP-binding cassette subfamily B protein